MHAGHAFWRMASSLACILTVSGGVHFQNCQWPTRKIQTNAIEKEKRAWQPLSLHVLIFLRLAFVFCSSFLVNFFSLLLFYHLFYERETLILMQDKVLLHEHPSDARLLVLPLERVALTAKCLTPSGHRLIFVIS